MTMRKVAAGVFLSVMAGAMTAAAQGHWLHVLVDETGGKGERMRVNVPLSMAEKVIPAIETRELHDGCVRLHGKFNGVDLPALMEAVQSAQDGEFVSVRQPGSDVRVAKQNGFLLIKVRDKGRQGEQVDVKIPLAVASALVSGGKNELDIAAGIRALREYGSTELVAVRGRDERVRIWVDSRNASD
jgi:hypothetical protein